MKMIISPQCFSAFLVKGTASGSRAMDCAHRRDETFKIVGLVISGK